MNPQNPQRYATTQYLLGMGPMPPPTNTELAVVQLQHTMDQGAFANMGYMAPGPGYAPPQYISQPRDPIPSSQPPSLQLDVHVPGPAVQETATTQATAVPPTVLEISIDNIAPEDFLARICARMEILDGDAQLGWKSSDDLKRDLPKRLSTEDDVKAAFDYFRPILLSKRRQKKIFMETINLAKPAEKTAAAPKVTETAYRDELNIVKAALACEKHRGHNRWCYVRRDNEKGERCVPLGLEEVTLWARKLHEDKAKPENERELDDKCTKYPDVFKLDDMEKVAAEREERSKNRKKGNAAPEFHLHMPATMAGIFGDVSNAQPAPKRGRDTEDSDNDSDDDTPAVSISDVLSVLHKKMPDLNYPQYEASLRGGFDRDFYVKEIGMVKGAVQEFIKVAKKVAKGKGKKRARVESEHDKEN
ncbi:hypothetical protein R3P38DRAFT_3272015 [Favolaschia claudopus]|uniref:Uncharacterized protein n=1 Tax=Favolaschia claudopus TaxID=2862362 RepID=A0AAW0B661_9AGAR